MAESCTEHNAYEPFTAKPLSVVLIMTCVYIILIIERPWESIRYLEGIPIERVYAIAMIIVAFLHNRFRIISSPTNKWVYGLLSLHFVLAPFAFRPEYAVEQGVEYAKAIILYLLMLAVVDDERTLKILVKAFVFAMMIYVVHSLWEYHNGRMVWRMGISRMVGVDSTFNDPNSFGASVVLSLPFVYALLRTEAVKLHRRLYYGYFAMAVLCVVLTGSRSASIALVFLLLLWGVMQQGSRKFVILASVVVLLGAVWLSMPAEKQERIRTLWDKDAGPANAHESADGRRLGLLAGWEMFKQAPLTGIGAGGKNFIGYRKANSIYADAEGTTLQAHNLYGEVLGEFGIGGLVFLAGLIASTMSCCLAVRKRLILLNASASFPFFLGGAIIVSLLLLLLLGMSGHNFYRPLWLWLAAWAGSLMRLIHQSPDRLQFETSSSY